MKHKTQQDIVTQHLQSLQVGEAVTEKLYLPGLENTFKVEKPNDDVTQVKMRLPITHKVSLTTRAEVVSAVLQCIQSSSDIVGIKWQLSEEYIEVVKSQGAQVELNVNEENLHHILMNTIRSRAVINDLDWMFGDGYIRLTHENQQYI